MKSLLSRTVLVLLLCSATVFSQIPNPGFETWSGGNPNDWFVNNIAMLATPITQSSTAHSGSSALKGEVVSVTGGVFEPVAVSGNPPGFAVSQRHAVLNGYYQFSPNSGDEFVIACLMFNSESVIGGGETTITAAAGSYTAFSITIDYATNEIPDESLIDFAVVGPGSDDAHLGSWMLVDDLSFTGIASGFEGASSIPARFALHQNYPNPFNPSTRISFEVPEAGFVTLDILDMLGRHMATLVSESLERGPHVRTWNARGFPAGVYVYRLQSGTLVQTRKLTLVK